MKNKNYLGGLLLLLGALTAAGQTIAQAPYQSYAAGSTNAGVNPSYAIIGCNSSLDGVPGTPVVTSIDATSDKAGAVVQFYRVTAQGVCQYTNSTVTLFVDSTNGFNNSSGVIVVRHLADDSYERRVLTASGQSASTNLVVTVAPLATVVPGDIVYMCSSAFAPAIPLVTNALAEASMYLQLQGSLVTGQRGLPLLCEVDQTTAGGNIRSVSAKFVTGGGTASGGGSSSSDLLRPIGASKETRD